MECEIARAPLQQALNVLTAVTERKGTMPVLANILLKSDGKNKLLLVATDLTVMVATEIECTSSREGGITVHGKQLAEIVGAVEGDTVKFNLKQLNLEIRSGRARFTQSGIAERDFPKRWPTDGTFGTVNGKALYNVIERAGYAIAVEQSRLHLTGAALHSDGKAVTLYSTDGHRCAVATEPTDGPRIGGMLLPKKALEMLRRVVEGSETVELATPTPTLVIVKHGSTTVWLNCLDTQPAPIKNVIRDESPIKVHVPRKATLDLVRRASLAAGAEGNLAGGIKLSLKDKMLRASTESTGGSADDNIEVEYDGAPIQIGIGVKYLIDALEHMKTDEVQLQLQDPLQPLQLADDQGVIEAVIMPMRIEG